jgi:hypothetical protein
VINRGATSIRRAAVEAGPFAAIGNALSFYPPVYRHPSPSSYARAPDSADPAQVGRVNPNHPAALQSGMKMGSDSPEQHEHRVYTTCHAMPT